MIYRRKITLGANETVTVPVYGKYLRLLAGTGDIAATVFYKDGGSVDFDALTGVGMNLSREDTGEGFTQLQFVSVTAQVIDILASINESSDSRLVGDVNLNGTMNVINQVAGTRALGAQAYIAATVTKILFTDSTRLKAAIVFPTDVYIGYDNTVSAATGFFWPAAQIWIDENQSELWIYPVASGSAKFIQDKK